MAYSPARFALGVLLRAGVIGALVFAGLFMILARHWYASAAVAGGVALLVGLDLARSAAAVDRTLAQFIDGLFAEGYERPGSGGAPTHKLTAAIDRALDRLGQTRAERQRRFEYVQALVDNIAAAVMVVDETGAIEFANRAARRRLGETAPTLRQMTVLGEADLNLDELEKRAIQRALKLHEGNISHAAATLGLTRPALYRRMERHGL